MLCLRNRIIATGITVVLIAVLTGCGSSSSTTAPIVQSSGSTYLVEYVPGSSPATEGKTSFQLKVRKSADGSPATGLSLKLTPTMHMSTKNHGTPVDIVTESGTAGTYDCTVYYLMADHSSMGMLMGYWELDVQVGTETATFYPTVSAQMMGGDTPKTSMKSMTDVTSNKVYYLFNDGMVSHLSPTFRLYISRAENNPPTVFSAISAVSSPTGTVNPVVHVSTDTLFDLTSTGVTGTASDDGNGHYSIPGLTSLQSAGTYTVYVRLTVDGEVKTADGLVTNASGTNLYQSFKVTSH